MFRAIEDFEKTWDCRTEAMMGVYANLTDESLGQKVSADGRTLGKIAWHIVTTLGEMMGRTGLVIDCPAYDTAVPANVAQISAAYEKAAASVKDEVCKNWTDERLLEEIEMYGETWSRGKTLDVLIYHQSHHCGQLTVLMRQAGLPVCGACGPAREEWAKWGLTPME